MNVLLHTDQTAYSSAELHLARFIASNPNRPIPSAEQILTTTVEKLRSFGFSNSKGIAILGIAENKLTGVVPTLAFAETLTNEQLIKKLTTLQGIGRWTVEMFLMHTLHEPDILQVDDFRVREG